MKQRTHKILSLHLAVAMLMGLCLSGCGSEKEHENKTQESTQVSVQESNVTNSSDSQQEKEVLEDVTIQLWLGGPGKQKDADEVFKAFNEMLQDYVPNTTVEFNVMTTSEYGTQFSQMLASAEPVDLAWIASWVTGATQKNIDDGNFMPISDLLDEYGQGIKAQLGDMAIDVHRDKEGELYYLPSWQGLYQKKHGIYVPAELARLAGDTWLEDTQKIVYEWKNVDPSVENYQKVWDQFDTYLAAAKDAGKLGAGNSRRKFLTNGVVEVMNSAVATEWVGIMRMDDTFTVQDLAATEYFKTTCKNFAEWYQKGYVRSDVASVDPSTFVFVTNDEYTDNTYIIWEDLYLTESALDKNSKQYGTELAVIPVEEAGVLGKGDSTAMAIPYCADEPERAMMVLDAIYNVPELYQLLIYGIEGKHYTANEDGTITTPYGAEGTSDSDYGLWRWTIGTCANSLNTQADVPGYYQELSEAEKSASTNPFANFVFDTKEVEDVISALKASRLEYWDILQLGYLGADWEQAYNNMMAERKKAGVDKLIQEFDRQIKEYMKENNITSW